MTSTTPKTRRRDQNLEFAIIAAAWKELQQKGYAALTLESVAKRARTSRSVLARRWSSKAALIISAISYQLEQHPYTPPDLGQLRLELADYLAHASTLVPIISSIISLLSDSKFRKEYPSPDLLSHALIIEPTANLRLILQRAVQRDEIHAHKLTPPVVSLLNDLIGHHVLLYGAAPSAELRQTWIDEIFLPLILKRPESLTLN